MKKFGLIGAAGYVAPRHMKAIQETNNTLVAALDKSDSVGIIDSYFPAAHFFTEFERFDRFIDSLRRENDFNRLDYLSICSPNYLHDSHIRFGLRSDLDVICEKPLVLNPWNIDALKKIETETGRKVYSILQLRNHPSIISLKKKLETEALVNRSKFDVELTYITSRGNWYFYSWKADLDKSGGIASNIGIHFFDMLIFLFGSLEVVQVHFVSPSKISGFCEFENARVRWFLSVDIQDIPNEYLEMGKRTFRSITIDNREIEFSDGFADLHTNIYKDILDGYGFGLDDAYPSIDLISKIRNQKPSGINLDSHLFARKNNDYI
jgi:UDP-N-acetyl-2-amino-2-deoxyglucuronate dehydrogenase